MHRRASEDAARRAEKWESRMSELEKKNSATPRGLKDDEIAAVVVAGSIVAFFAVYWFFEIMSVRELLEMAYG